MTKTDTVIWIISGIISTAALLLSLIQVLDTKKRWARLLLGGIVIISIFSATMRIVNFPR